MMRRRLVSLGAILTLAASLASDAVSARQGVEHSDNMRLLGSYKHVEGPMAFEGNRLVTESGQGFLISQISRRSPHVRPLGSFRCPGGGRTISLWQGYVIQSGDRGNFEGQSPGCNNSRSTASSGIRIVDARDPQRPREVALLEGSCSQHSPGHALFPRGEVVYIYDAYELPWCTANEPEPLYMKVIKFDSARPRRARTVSTPETGNVEGCDRLTVHRERRLLACSAINRLQLFDLSDPVNPVAIGTMPMRSGFLWEASFTWDGRYLLAGQYLQGGDSCDLIIVDVSDPRLPMEAGRMAPPRSQPGSCRYPFSVSVIPTKDEQRRLAVVGWQGSGVSVVDFSDPTSPREHAYYGAPGVNWAYWYNGRIYALSEGRMLVLKLEETGLGSTHRLERFYPHTQAEAFR